MPDPKFAKPSEQWTAAEKREYNQEVMDAYADGMLKGDPKIIDETHSIKALLAEEKTAAAEKRKVKMSPTNAGALAAYKKQSELTGYDISQEK